MNQEMKVGAFVLTGLLCAGLTIFLIGDARRMFESKEVYRTSFTEVGGLKPGSPVQMGGVHIGEVRAVEYSTDENSDEIVVTLAVVQSEARRIRADSEAVVAPKGMLGDKLLSLSVGSLDKPRLQPGDMIRGGEAGDLIGQLSSLGDKLEGAIGNIEKASEPLADEQFHRDMQGSMSRLHAILETVDKGEGFVPRLLNDPKEAAKLSRVISNLERTSNRLNGVLAEAQTAVRRVNEGPGLVHELLYGEQGVAALTQIGNAAEELAVTLKGVREGDGLAHDVLFGGGDSSSTQVMADLAAITKDARAMTRQLREGKGTLGALMVDPSVYEDLKVLLGNVQRNEVLRALVRYSIKQDDKRRGVEVRGSESRSRVSGTGVPAGAAPPASKPAVAGELKSR